MKDVITFKIGKERIAFWQLIVILFILFMFMICLFLGFGFMTHSSKQVNVETSELDTSVKTIITDFSSLTKLFDKDTNLKDKYTKNYHKYISDNDGFLVLDNAEYNYFGNINSSVYRININSKKWFLFNELNNKLIDSNIIYVVDSDMNFHRLNIVSNTVVKNYTPEEGYKKFEKNEFVFYYSIDADYFYGYMYVGGDSINDYYITVSGEGYGLPEDSYYKLFSDITENIKVSNSDTYSYVGMILSNEYKNFKIDENLSLDLYSNILMSNISNGTKKNRNKITFSYKDKPSRIVSISEVNKTIDEYTKNTKKNGYLQYTYGTKTIYLKYNINDYPEFNYSLGGFNGIVTQVGDKSLLIQFDKTFEFDSQEVLESTLEELLSPFIVS